MSTAILKKITSEAKRIRKKSPRTSWQSAVKQAGAKFRKSAKKKPAKKAAVKRKSAKRVGTIATRPDTFGSSISGIMGRGKKVLIAEIGKLEAKKFAARTDREKKQIAKKIAEKKRQYRKLS